MTRRLTPRPASQPFGELIVIGAASIAIGLVACASSNSNNRAPTCGPCCHGSHGPECQPQAREPVETVSDASVEDASSSESTADIASTDASSVATDPTLGQSSAMPPPPPPRDAGVTRDAGTSGRRRGTTSNPNLGPDRSNAVGPAPTCGPRCHNPGGADDDTITNQ